MKMHSIQFASDIHLEIKSCKFSKLIQPTGDILILVGDIGNPFTRIYYDFLKWCGRKFEYVFLVPGNHEYYGNSLKKGKRRLEKICRQTNVRLLDRNYGLIQKYNLVILGCTLWSYIPRNKFWSVELYINDYSYISDFTPKDSNKLFHENMEWLQDTIKKFREGSPTYTIIVATHHAPIPEITSSPEYRGKDTNCAFASDCSSVMQGVHTWIYGHTHYNSTFDHNLQNGETIRITSNQKGYSREDTGYDPSKLLCFN